MPRRRATAPVPAPGQVWREHRWDGVLPGSSGLHYKPTGRELWIRSVGKARRGYANDERTVKADSVRGDKARRTEIYAHNVRPPRWQLVEGRSAQPLARGRRRRVERDQLPLLGGGA